MKINWCGAGTNSCISQNTGFAYSGGTTTSSGDSGGPIYSVNWSNKAVIAGLHAGVTILANGTRIMIGVGIDAVLKSYNVSLMTS